MLKQIFIKTTDQKVLTYLLKNSSKEVYNRAMAKELKINESASWASIKKLYNEGILLKRSAGKTLLYRVNEDYPLITTLKSFVAILELDELVEKLKDMSQQIIVFGSVAKGLYDLQEESDLDLFVISQQREKVLKTINQFRSDFIIKPIIKSRSEFIKMQKKDKIFFRQVSQGIVLWKQSYE